MFKLNIVDEMKTSDENPSHLKIEYLQSYSSGNVFVETGTYLGDTVKLALGMNFDSIHSIELNDELYEKAVNLFESEKNVKIWHGDSVDCLEEIVTNHLTTPATFWLDAHASGPLTGGKSGGCPLVDELKSIQKSSIKTHTIFIDDRRLFGSAEWSYVQESEVMELLNQINPDYKILYLDGHIPNDVICATVR